ncbi:hypothetical protein, variant [Verruconis gallopava]|uniref:Transcription initiation factor TFIID subunit 12 domain-containing protein n=1 Tax=Verruconis gallopava TaxID=253628 RepID=A0A0D2B2R1_9PEZI|nr:uncharacterized protein PV09_03436 [Verruconis gallopava]XP_016215428.1 hypothetical protein, variant [Verruconis gallopava]KIW05558.1 hypothetical protein PV09_03436 [Verruconis gallopava]KIW05559.1 hypothetical protein, variant [Verruconis gallopava]
MQANNQQPQPGQVNMNQLVRAQHIQQLPNLSTQQKASLVQAVSQCSAVVQNSTPGSPEHNRALLQWQSITQKYIQARNVASRNASQAANAASAGQSSQTGQVNLQGQNVPQQNQNVNQANQGQQGSGQAGASAQGAQAQNQPQIPKQIMDFVNNYTYYHPSGIGPGHPKYEEYRQDVKVKHAKILFDNERNKNELKKIRGRIEQLRQAGQEVPAQLEEMRQQVETKTNELGQQLQKWMHSQKASKEKYEQARQAGSVAGQQGQPSDGSALASGTNRQMNMPGGNAQGNQASPVTGPQQVTNNNNRGPISPGVPNTQAQNMNAQPTNNNFVSQPSGAGQANNNQSAPQQTPQSAGPQVQRPGISNQQPPMSGMQQMPQNGQQSGQPTPLSHQQALQRAYSGGTPQAVGAASSQPPHAAPHQQPYVGGQVPPRETSTTSTSTMNPSAKMMTPKVISPSLSAPPVPVQNFPQARPTMAGPGNGVGGVLGTPAIVKQSFNMESTENGGVLSKKKLDELVRQVTGGGEGMGGEMLTPEVEEAVLMMADEFVDNVITAACKLAKLRDSSTLDVRDIQLILERNYNIRIPGYASDELRAIRKFAPAPGWTAKMNAIQAAKVMGGKSEI